MYYITADEHFSHTNIIKYANRPFQSIKEMDFEIIDRHNEIVGKDDTTIHAGDFTLISRYQDVEKYYISNLKGNHIFLKGSHDKWLSTKNYLLELNVGGFYVVICHYAMRVWPRSHYGSYHLYAHSHGHLPSVGRSMDIGVDTNNFYPYSFDCIVELMKTKPLPTNLVIDQQGKWK